MTFKELKQNRQTEMSKKFWDYFRYPLHENEVLLFHSSSMEAVIELVVEKIECVRKRYIHIHEDECKEDELACREMVEIDERIRSVLTSLKSLLLAELKEIQ